MNYWTIKFKQTVLSLAAATMGMTGSNTVGAAGLATVAFMATSSDSEARTVRGAARSTGRRTARRTTSRNVGYGYAPAVRSTARRTARRTSRRVTRRHLYTLPVGYAAVSLAGYRYYRYGGLYYYPYYVSGQTVYVQVDVDPNNPGPPPPVDSVTEEYELDD
jgi:hypothetical protein